MSSQDIRRINESLTKGLLPPELNFLQTNYSADSVDWDKVRYNAFYRSPEFFLERFPTGFENIPGSEKIIEEMISQVKKTPLEEVEERQREALVSGLPGNEEDKNIINI